MPINVFGGGAVQTAYVGQISFDLTDNSLTLVWPTSYVDVPYTNAVTGINYNVLAAYMTIFATAADRTITLPDARQGSIGSNFIISNISTEPFTLLFADGTDFFTVTNGVSYYAILTDNSSGNGTWEQLTFGAGTSAADPIALAGPGLVPYPVNATELSTNTPVQSKAANYTVVQTDRANLIVWTGGSGQITLPTGAVAAGFYLSINNQGSGAVVVTTDSIPNTIDNQASITLEIAESAMFIWDGNLWWTVGLGQSESNSIQVNNLILPNQESYPNVVLTAAEALFQIQQYKGVLTTNTTVFFPDSTNDWYIANLTTGAFTLSVCLGTALAPVGSPTILPQGNKAIFYAEAGSGMFIIPNYIADEINFHDGTAAAPGITFENDQTTGVYRGILPTTFLGIAVSGAQQAQFNPVGLLMAPGKTITIPDSTNIATSTFSTSATSSLFSYKKGDFTSSFGIATGGSTGQFTFQSGGTPFTTLTTDVNGLTFVAKGLTFSSQLNLNGSGTESVITCSVPGTPSIGTASLGIYNVGGMQFIYTNGANNGIMRLSGGANNSQVIISSSAANPENSTLVFTSSDGGTGAISNNSVPSINISSTGVVSFPLRGATLNALMPSAALNNTLVYYNSSDSSWDILTPPATAGTFTLTVTNGVMAWV